MSCTRPLDGYRATGGAVIIVQRGDRPPRNSTTRVPMSIPCGKCIGCKMEYSRQWGLRCMHEAKMWPVSSYVTLTYNDESLPPGGSVCVRDVQLFMKRLKEKRRKEVLKSGRDFDLEKDVIRYFLGAEYGEDNKRPHYHALLFNCGFRDLRQLGTNKRGEPLYTSAELSDLWSIDGKTLGFCTIGSVTYDSAVYCAKYALKKVDGQKREAGHYVVYDADGQVFERSPEFAVMSRRPGIGAGYVDKYGAEIVSHDNVIVDGKGVRPPRYYHLRLGKDGENTVELEGNRRARKRRAVLNRDDNTPDRLRVKEEIMKAGVKENRRKL